MSDCIEWPNARDTTGYGVRWVDGKCVGAHRAAWTDTNGPIPTGMLVLHACDNPPCVNPDHLFLGTHADNMRDMAAKGRNVPTGAVQPDELVTGKAWTACARGHERTPENVYVTKSGKRQCRPCHQLRYAARRGAA